MKDWKRVADNLSKSRLELGLGLSSGLMAKQSGIPDAHRDGKRFVVRADEKLTAFLDLRRAIHAFAVDLIW